MSIAILGGSFDPPHNGHFLVITQILKFRPDIEKILLVPVFKHQWKPVNASVKDRLNMLSFLTSEKVEISDIEIKRKGISYTIDTIKEIKSANSKSKIYWIVGSDILSEWHRWEKKDELTSLATFLIFPRDPYNIPKKIPKGFEIINNKEIITTDVSSTEIRQRIKQKLPISSMLPKEVEKYIIERKLYKSELT